MKIQVYGVSLSGSPEYPDKAFFAPTQPKADDRARGFIPAPTTITKPALEGFVGSGMYEADVEIDSNVGYGGKENRSGFIITGLKLLGLHTVTAPGAGNTANQPAPAKAS